MTLFHLLIVLSAILVSPTLSKKSCRASEFRCKDGTCINIHEVCNGRMDCLDHSDEESCTNRTCQSPEWFLCADNRTCLSHKFVCDSYENCPIGDDEKGCDTVLEKRPGDHCSKYEYTCMDKSCIPLGLECDGKMDCPDNSDEVEGCEQLERSCPGYLCKNKRCLSSIEWVCDDQDDCGDGSDENGCMAHCKLEDNEFFCKEDIKCISLDMVCDNKTDCSDSSDEHNLCEQSTKTCNKLNCPEKCHMLPTGPVCICAKGFEYDDKSNTCNDINECNIYGICSHNCVNTKGSFRCTCEDKYVLKSDGKSCEAPQGDAMMLYTTQKTVVGVNLKSRHLYKVAQFLSQVIGVTYDGIYVYWTDINESEESIERAKIDGSKREVLFTVGLETPEAVAIDWYTGNIYFTDNNNKHLAVCTNHGLDCLALIQYELDQPRGVALDPKHGKVYWTDWGKKANIGRGSMDGTNIEKFVKTDIHWPNGLCLDSPNDRIYWVDAKIGKIQSVKLDGSDRRTVLDRIPKHPYGIAIFEDKLYWSDWGTSSIHSCHKFTGKNHEVLVKDRKIYDIHIYHPILMQKGNHSCLDHHCSHICLLNDKQSFTCACPESMILEVDMRTCKDSGKKQNLFLGVSNYLIILEHTKFGRHKIGNGIPLDIYVQKLAYNSVNATIFIADNIQKMICELNLQTQKTTVLVSRGIENVTSLSFDSLSHSLYWTDGNLQTIEVLSLQNRKRAIVYRFSGDAVPLSMALLPEVGKIFIALRSGVDTQIDILSIHGNRQHHFADGRIGLGEIDFVVDTLSETVFWLDSGENKIEFTDYDGSNRHLFRTFLNRPVSMALLDEDVVWTTWGKRDIYWTHRSNLASVKKFSIAKLPYMSVPDVMPIAASSPSYVVSHPCLRDNGGCSHVCLAAGKKFVSCLCPVGLVFKDGTNKTCIEQLDCEFRCKSGECITMSRYCNGHKDCVDGTDETECEGKKPATCKLNEFACHNRKQCIMQRHRCDKHPDCDDKSDEDNCEHFDHITKCHKLQFACENGRCIDPLSICDGNDDCGDNSDETSVCKSDVHWGEICGDDMFRCTTGQCIPKQWECDGHLDCKLGSDEHDKCPSKPCPIQTFRCKQGICIDELLKCDGHNDCGDYSDEINCEAKLNLNISCGNSGNDGSMFQCSSDPTICLDVSAKCNGTAECPRGEDEADCHGCRHDEFECTQSKLCIRKDFRCDKEKDCPDGSDELHCTNYNASSLHSFAMACQKGLFDCKDGTCIDWLRVCDGTHDCTEGEDELNACQTSCINHACEQKCSPSPYGPICSCHPGYKLSGNGKLCVDIDECAEMDPCSQLCENNYGSFRCKCYPDFMLWSDKIRCKSIERGHFLLFSSFNQLRKLSENPSSLEIIYKSNDSTFSGIDVNVRRNVVYFSLKDTRSLFEYNLGNQKIRFISDVGNPKKIAVDWVTNNVYYIDDSAEHSINTCYFSDKSACARLIRLKKNEVAKGITVDASNKYLFYAVMTYSSGTQPRTTIYRSELDGTRVKILITKYMDVSAMESEPYKKVLYYTDILSKRLLSISYEGENAKTLIKHERAIVYPSGLSIYENAAFIINMGSPEGLWCPLYGHKPCRALALNVYNAEDVVIVAASRQKSSENNCESHKCSLICVQAKLGAKCLCHDGSYVQEDVQCPKGDFSGVGHRYVNHLDVVEISSEKLVSSSSGVTLAVCLTIMGFILISLLVYMIYRKRTGRGNFKININFHNPLVRPQNTKTISKMCRPAMSFSKNKTNMVLDTKKNTYRTARNVVGGENSDCESMRDLENIDESPRARLVL